MIPLLRGGLHTAAALVVAALCGVPLLALAIAVANPAPDPFSGAAPSLGAAFGAAGGWRLLWRSVLLAVGVAAVALPAGTWLAWVEHRLSFPGRAVVAVLTVVPLAMPSYVLAACVARSLGPGGWLPLFERVSGLPAAVGVLGVVTVPYVQLIVGASLVHGSAAEEEAARSLGASPLRVFRQIVLPRIRTSLGYAGLLAMLYALSDFGAVAVLDTPVLTWRLYQAVAGQDLARAAVLGATLIGATLPLFGVARLVGGGEGPHQVANPRQPARVPASVGALLLTAVIAGLVFGIGVVLPVATLVAWVLDGLRRQLPFAPLWLPVAHTLAAAAVGSAVTGAAAALPAAVVGVRRRTGLLDPATYLTSALPGVLLAFGWILAGLTLARALPGRGLYGALLSSGVLLLAGYATRFVAEAYTPIKASLWRLDLRLIESHRALRAPPTRLLRAVVLPQIGPGLGVGLLIAFLAILKELPVTLLLGGATGLSTLAFRVWDRSEEALWHDAGAAGLVLVGLALGGVIVSLRWRERG